MDPSKSVTSGIFSEKFLLPAILLLSFALRFWGVWFGLPYLYHADEPVVVNHALAFGSGDLNPHFFNIPPLVSYLLFFCYGIYFLVGRGTGIFHSVTDFESLFFVDPSSFYLIARLALGVLMGTLSVYFLYRLVKKLWSREAALWAALFLGVNFLHVRDSHYVYTDIPLVLVMILGFFVILRISEGDNFSRDFKRTVPVMHLFAGAMIGLATAVKYNGAFLAIPYLWICFKGVPWRKWPVSWLLAGAGALGVFVLLNPFSVLDWRLFLKEITEQGAANQGGLPWRHHFQYSLVGAFGAPLLAVALAGWVRGLFSKNVRLQSIAVFVLGYYLVLVRWGQPYDRYVLPLVPALCLLAADFLVSVWSSPGVESHGFVAKHRVLTAVVAVALLAGPSFLKIVQWDRIMSAKDVRTIAKEWVGKNVPNGSRIALDWEFYMPRLVFSKAQLVKKTMEKGLTEAQKRRLSAMIKRSAGPAYDLFFLVGDTNAPRFLFGRPVVPFDTNALKQRGIGYVFVAGGIRPENDVFLRELRATGVPIATFTPFKDKTQTQLLDPWTMTGGPFLWPDILARDRNGYPIRIYRLKQA